MVHLLCTSKVLMRLSVFIFKSFRPHNVVILFLFSLKPFYLLIAKSTPDVNNYPLLGILEIKNILIQLLTSMKLYTSMPHGTYD